MSELDTALAPVNDIRPGAVPGWVDTLFYGLAIYIALGAAAMLTGLGGPTITHYVGLLADTPANVANLVIAAAAAHHTRRGKQRTAWVWVSIALGLYCIGSIIAQASWLHGRDPFPGPADIFFTAFYPALLLASLYMIRAAAVRVPWVQLFLDATIFVVGFGAFFWFLVIRPAASDTEVDFLKTRAESGLRRDGLPAAAHAGRAPDDWCEKSGRPACAAAAGIRLHHNVSR